MDEEFRREMAADPATALSGFELSEADRQVLARQDLAQMLREVSIEQTINGVGGWVADDLAFVKPWGFDPAAIRVPVQISYGTSDVLVPRQHGEWLAATVPGAEVRLNQLGHLGDPDTDLVEQMAWLTGGTRSRNRNVR